MIQSTIIRRIQRSVASALDRLLEVPALGFVYMVVVLPLFLLLAIGSGIGAIPGVMLHALAWKKVEVDSAPEWTKLLHDISLLVLGVTSAAAFWLYAIPYLGGYERDDGRCSTEPYC